MFLPDEIGVGSATIRRILVSKGVKIRRGGDARQQRFRLLDSLAVGDEVVADLSGLKMRYTYLYEIGYRRGMRFVVNKIDENRYRVIRIG